MEVGKFFLSIFVKGGGETQKTLGSVAQGFSTVKETGLASKVAILGALYGLEQLAARGMNTGMAMEQFARGTEESTQELQKWQQAALDFGVSGEEVEQTVRSIKEAVLKAKSGLGEPEGWQKFLTDAHIDLTRLEDSFYMMKKMQEYFQGGNTVYKEQFVHGLGVSNKMAQMFKGLGDKDVSKITPMYTEGELKRLAHMKVEINKLWFDIESKFAKMISKHEAFVKEIHGLAAAIVDLIGAMAQFAEKIKLIEGVVLATKGLTSILKGEYDPKKDPLLTFPSRLMEMLTSDDMLWWKKLEPSVPGKSIKDMWNERNVAPKKFKSIFEEDKPKEKSGKQGKVDVHQYFYGDADPELVGDASQKGIDSYFRGSRAAIMLS